MRVSSNFNFLAGHDESFACLGAIAERYFHDDPPSALIKLRQLAEFIAKDVAARHGLLPANSVSLDEVPRTLPRFRDACLPKPLHPPNRRAHRHRKLCRRLMTRQATSFYRRNHSLPRVG